jgi:hypothetical protein
LVEKDEYYLDQFKDIINDTVSIINDINNSDTAEEKLLKYMRYFPEEGMFSMMS